MIDQQLEVGKILTELKNVGFPTSKVEKELPISSGYLYKVKRGTKFMTEEKLEELRAYHLKHCKKVVHQSPVIIHTPKKNLLPTKNMPFVEIKVTEPKKKAAEPKPGSLSDMMREVRSAPGRSVAEPYKRSKI